MNPQALIANANALHIPLADKSVQCVVTSPPYYSLRDYGVAGQIGLEPTPEAYVENLVAVFREVRRVLKDDGVLWLNLGDSYAGGGNYRGTSSEETLSEKQRSNRGARGVSQLLGAKNTPSCKPKDLIGIPWMVAFALRADGWYLRQDIIWAKPNPMPESVTDRCTKAHEYLFLLTKSAQYFYDAEAIKEPSSEYDWKSRLERQSNKSAPTDKINGIRQRPRKFGGTSDDRKNNDRRDYEYAGDMPLRNKRDVWTVATTPYKEAHFATWPEKLVEPMILAGTSQKGQCPICGAAWTHKIERKSNYEKRETAHMPNNTQTKVDSSGWFPPTLVDNGWQPSCACDAGEPIPQVVFDPFSGSGTSGRVAIRLGRSYIGLDLNMQYIALKEKRLTVQMEMI